MARLFREHPEELEVTIEIALRCTFELKRPAYEFPRPTSLHLTPTRSRVLIDEVRQGARTLLPGTDHHSAP